MAVDYSSLERMFITNTALPADDETLGLVQYLRPNICSRSSSDVAEVLITISKNPCVLFTSEADYVWCKFAPG